MSLGGKFFGSITITPSIIGLACTLSMAIAVLLETRTIRATTRKLRASIHPKPSTTRVETTKVAKPQLAETAPRTALIPNDDAVTRTATGPANPVPTRVPSLQNTVLVKLEGGQKVLTCCGVLMIMQALTMLSIGLSIPFQGPNQLALFALPSILDQVISYLEMRVIAVSMDKVSSSKVHVSAMTR